MRDNKRETQENSLTSDFRRLATPEQREARRKVKAAANARNKANQRAIGEWHNESRGKMTPVPFPLRRTA